MAGREKSIPTKRPAPSVLSGLLTTLIRVLFWLALSLLFSIIIEWIGMTWIWKEEGKQHAISIRNTEIRYLTEHTRSRSDAMSEDVTHIVSEMMDWIDQQVRVYRLKSPLSLPSPSQSRFTQWRNSLYQHIEPYMAVVPIISQLFVIRLAIIVLSLPVFIVFALVGAVDGLVERELRRWGGGRESSNLYNLARKSIYPAFISACVLYISAPFSVHPVWILLPFAVLTGLSFRVSCCQLKKYF